MNRVVAGGVVAVIACGMLWLGSLLPFGFGTGSGNGNGNGDGDGTKTQKTSEVENPVIAGMLEIAVDHDQIKIGDKVVTAAEVAQLAKDNKVDVRILRYSHSENVPMKELRNLLEQNSIKYIISDK